jgi:hypothetical protein
MEANEQANRESKYTVSPMFRNEGRPRPSQSIMEMTAPNGRVTLVEEVTAEMYKDEDEDTFFDTIGVQFHFGPFLWQLIAHLILPLFPFMINRSGQLQNDVYTRFTSWVTPILIYIMFLSYTYIPDHMSTGVRGAFLIPVIYVLQHRLVIAIKYGSLSPTEYKRFMECKDTALCRVYLDQMQLFQGWYYYNPRVVRFEISAASARTGARINDIDFCIADPHDSPSTLNQCRAWNAFLRGHDIIDYNSAPCDQLRLQADGSYALSVYDFCEALVQKSVRAKPETELWSGRVTDFFNLLNLSIPLILMGCYYDTSADHSGQKAWLAFFYISSTMLNFFYAKLFFILLNIAVVDVFRQWTIISDLNTMIRMTDLSLYAELSSSHKLVTREQQRTVDLRMEEILSIRPSRKGKKYMHTECLNDDSAVHTNGTATSTNATRTAAPTATNASASADAGAGPKRAWQAPAPTTAAHKRASVLGERIYKDNEAHLLPRVSFDSTQNIVAWTHARLTMQNYGERFHFRLSLYVICAMFMLVMFMLLGLVHMAAAARPVELFLTPWFMQLLLSVTMVIFFLALIMLTGSCANETLERHSESFSAHGMRIYRKITSLQRDLDALCYHSRCEADKKKAGTDQATAESATADKEQTLRDEIDTLHGVLEALDDMRDVVETNTAAKPFKIFGFTASSSLTMSIMTTAFSFYAIIVSMLFKQDSQVLSAMGE